MSEWINVKDRLPEEEGLYLSFINCEDGETTTILYYTKENQFAWMPATHWMPLPEPPKEDCKHDFCDILLTVIPPKMQCVKCGYITKV